MPNVRFLAKSKSIPVGNREFVSSLELGGHGSVPKNVGIGLKLGFISTFPIILHVGVTVLCPPEQRFPSKSL